MRSLVDDTAKVLVVDDDELFCAALRRSLAGAGYTVAVAHGTREAMRELNRDVPDIVLLDLALDGEYGLDVLVAMLSAGFRMPVIMLTAESRTQNKVKAFDFGVSDYVAKPFEFEELDARIRRLLRERKNEEAIRIGEITLKHSEMAVWVGARRVDLTRREFLVLARLASTLGQMVSKEQLWTASGATGEVDSVRVVVRRLRRKLGAAKDQLRTVWGKGFVLERGA